MASRASSRNARTLDKLLELPLVLRRTEISQQTIMQKKKFFKPDVDGGLIMELLKSG
jgi:hypothetical protein